MKIPVFFLILTLTTLFLTLSFLRINKVEVTQDVSQCATNEEIEKALGLKERNFFLVDLKKIQDVLREKFYCIASVKTDRYLPNKIVLNISGRQAYAILKILKNNVATPSAGEILDTYVIDREGVVFSKEGSETLPKIYLSAAKLDLGQKLTGSVGNLVKILDTMELINAGFRQGSVSGEIFTAQTQGSEILFNLGDKIDIQLASLQLILGEAKIDFSRLEFIDLRFDKPIVKYAPEK